MRMYAHINIDPSTMLKVHSFSILALKIAIK